MALQAGNIVARYAKLHLYDAFAIQESRHVDAGNEIAPLLEVEGMKVGLMTCYDLRFPELALAQALVGAEIPGYFLPPGSRPPQRASLVNVIAARALDTTVIWCGGGGSAEQKYRSKPIIDPFGVTHCGSVRNACTIMAEVTPEPCVRQVRAIACSNNRRLAPQL